MMCFKLLGSLILIFLAIPTQNYGAYLITTPRRWTKGEETKVCVSLSEPPTAEDVISLSITENRDDVDKTVFEKDLFFTTGEENICFRLALPDEIFIKTKLHITGSLLKNELNYTRNINIARDVAKTFVQTDKFLYKPSQEVQFRILTVIGPLLEVSTEKYPSIWVENPSGSRIWQWTDVDNSKGLLHKSFTLTDEPEEGIYKIRVSTPYGTTLDSSFKVEEYVLPKYEVTINPPPYVLGTSEVITFEVCAKYTFGQPVKGNLTLTVDNNGWGENKVVVEKEALISGCKSLNFTSEELAINGDSFFAYALKASATVVEDGTEVVLNSERKTVRITRTALTFIDVGLQDFIKPELPFIVELLIQFPDESVVANELMSVCIRDNCKNFTTNSNGLLKFAVPSHISGKPIVKAVNYGRIESGNSWRSVMYESNFVKSAKKYHSPSNSSLVIALSEKKLNCTPDKEMLSLDLPVRFTAIDQPSALVTIMVISRGQIQFFKTIQQDLNSGSTLHVADDLYLEPPIEPVTKGLIRGYFTIPMLLPKTVSPKAKVFVWYARDDGEVVSDVRTLDISECLLNDVTFAWSEEQVRPGDISLMTLEAEPLSLCSLGVVDKSVELLSSKNDLTAKKLLDIAEKASVGEYENLQVNDFEYCRKKENETTSLLIPSVVLPEASKPGPTVEPEEPPAEEQSSAQDQTGKEGEPSPEEPQGSSSRKKRGSGWRPFYSLDIDSLHMFDMAGLYVFSDYTLESRPCNAHYIPFAVPMESNQFLQVAFASQGFGWSKTKERIYFPETWLWNLVPLGDSGSHAENFTLPDTVTEWVGKAVCVHPTQGIGISEKSSITTFRDFFVDLTLPPMAKRGEVFPVKISVFNYLSEPLSVKVTLLQSQDFDILAEDSAKVGSGERSSCIQAQDKVVHSIKIRPKTSGNVNITIDALANTNAVTSCGNGTAKERRDVVIRPISVEFEGIPKEDTWTKYICSTDLKNGEDVLETWTVKAPEEIIQDSARGWVTIAGDLMGPTIGNLAKLVKMPYGCGEQNMLNFAPNIFVLEYLTASNQTDEKINKYATKYMEKGYQRELNYRHGDGSYSAFGERDESGSTWLTAFVLKCFARAKPYIIIDEDDLAVSSKWLKTLQMENGCFSSVGKVLHKGMKGGIGNSDAPLLTSFVLIALMEAGEDSTSRTVRESLFCLKADNTTTPYSLAVRAYALALAKVPEAQSAIDSLLAQAETTRSTMHWTPSKRSKGLDVEIGAYAILALLTLDAKKYEIETRKIVKWVNKKRNGQGGFVSTQDTIIALQALAAYEESTPQIALDATVFADMNAHEETFILNDENKFLLQRADIPSFPSDVTLSLEGQGCILAQAVIRYNIPKPEASEAFTLSVNATTEPDRGCKTKRLSACAAYVLPDLTSNMAILEVEIVTGYIPEKRDLKQIVGTGKGLIKRYEVDGSKVMFYVDEFSSEETCVSFRVLREFDVEDAKNATVTVYDYYKPEYALSESYRFPPADDCVKTVVEEVEIGPSSTGGNVGVGLRRFAPPEAL